MSLKPLLPRHQDNIQNMLDCVEHGLGDVAVINGRRVRGFFEIRYGSQISLGGSRMSKPTRVTMFKFRRCFFADVKCGMTVFINNIFYNVSSIREADCDYLMLYLKNCTECAE